MESSFGMIQGFIDPLAGPPQKRVTRQSLPSLWRSASRFAERNNNGQSRKRTILRPVKCRAEIGSERQQFKHCSTIVTTIAFLRPGLRTAKDDDRQSAPGDCAPLSDDAAGGALPAHSGTPP
jgi:hypothetical protein